MGGSGYTDDLPWTPRLTPAFKLAPRFAYLNPQLVSTALTFTLLYHPTHGAKTTRPTEPRLSTDYQTFSKSLSNCTINIVLLIYCTKGVPASFKLHILIPFHKSLTTLTLPEKLLWNCWVQRPRSQQAPQPFAIKYILD